MLWATGNIFRELPFDVESDLENAILQVAPSLFGENRYYLDVKRRIGATGRTRNVPDGYLLDLSSGREPKLYVVENELAKHDPLRHIAVQILEFSLSFESSPQAVKQIVKEAVRARPDVVAKCQEFASHHGFE